MLIIKIVEDKIADDYEDYLKRQDFGYTRNGNEFEIPSADPVGWTLGRRYEYILNKYKNELQIQEKEEVRKDISGLAP